MLTKAKKLFLNFQLFDLIIIFIIVIIMFFLVDLKAIPDVTRVPRRSIHCSEEDTKILGGYHWDCSDWVRRSQNPLPNISEVPGSEVPDSSSFHSDSNDEVHHHIIGKF